MGKSNEKKAKNKSILASILFIIICLGLGIALGIGMNIYEETYNQSIPFSVFLLIIAVIYLNLFVQINLHEFGHFIVGKLFNYKLISYRIGPLSWDYENGNMKFTIKRNKGYGGLCAMLPQGEINPIQYALFIAGGVILNSVAVIIFIILFNVYLPTQSLLLLGSLLGCIIITLLMVITNALPIAIGPIQTDGQLFFNLIKRNEKSAQMLDMFQLTTQLSGGVRPRDLIIKRELSICDNKLNQFDIQQLLYSYFQALDSGNTTTLHTLISIFEAHLEEINVVFLPGILHELIYYYLVIESNEEKAKTYLQKVEKQLKQDKDVNGCRINCACALYLEHDELKAMSYYELGLKVADKFPFKGQAMLEVDLLKFMMEGK